VVFGVGDDPTAKVARTPGSNQTLVHQLLCGPSTQTCTLWVQQVPTLVSATGTAITINDTAPTADAYNLSLVEVKPWRRRQLSPVLRPRRGDWYVSYDYRYRIWNHARREHSNFRWNICDRDCLEQYEHCCHGSQWRGAWRGPGGGFGAGSRNKQLGDFHGGVATDDLGADIPAANANN